MIFSDLSKQALQQNTSFDQHETVRRFVLGEGDGLVALVAVHNTNLGPALGGCRMRAYASEEEAMTDVLRLSRGMTYKNAMAGLPLGGGKSVIIGDFRKDKNASIWKRWARALKRSKGNM